MHGKPDLGPRPDPGQDIAGGALPGRLEQQLAGGRDAAPDRNHVGVEGVDHVRDPDAEAPTELRQQPDRDLVAPLGAVDGVVAGDLVAPGEAPAQIGVGMGGRRRLREPIERPSRPRRPRASPAAGSPSGRERRPRGRGRSACDRAPPPHPSRHGRGDRRGRRPAASRHRRADRGGLEHLSLVTERRRRARDR